MLDRMLFSALLAGTLVAGGCASSHAEREDEDEVKMAIADVPAPVRETLTREAKNNAITTVDRETDDGKTIYEADVMLDGKNWEIKVDPAGKLLSKKIDNEAEDDDDKAGDKPGDDEDHPKV